MAYGIVLAVSTAAGWTLTHASIRLARKYGVLDHPTDHKIHSTATPRLGGIGIVLGTAFGIATASLLGISFDMRMYVFAMGGLAMAFLGVTDDLLCLKASYKLAGQVAIAAGVGLGIGLTGYMGSAEAIVTALLIVLLTNAVNLIDGMDGLAAGVVLVASFAYASILLSAGNTTAAVLSLVVAGACVGLLPHNWHPARTFMGDSGSLFLGYCLAVQMSLSFAESGSTWSYAASIAVAGIPLTDISLSVIRRLLARKPLFSPDAAHTYNLLAERFHLEHSTTVLAFYLAGACFASAGVFAFASTRLLAGLSLALLCVLIGFAVSTLRLFRMEG